MNHLLGITQLRNSQTSLITAENVYGKNDWAVWQSL